MSFDPAAAAVPGSGIFGLPTPVEEARVLVVPVPFAATTSYGGGAQDGPAAVLAASCQIDLFDVETGRPYEAGIAMLPIPDDLRACHEEARGEAMKVLERGGHIGHDADLERALSRVNGLSEYVNARVYETCRELIAHGRLVALLGGDHSTPFGAIRAVSEAHPGVGILHIDAHADLRDAFEGFVNSHASIMHNVMTHCPGVARLVQVGIRDCSEDEVLAIQGSDGRIRTHFDASLARRRLAGEPWAKTAEAIVSGLPREVYVSFDVDGLDPSLCPHTGTPVPGGLSFHEATYLVGEIARSGRLIVGVDLNEVVPGPDGDEWDGNVGARLLYKMIGWMVVSQGLCAAPASVL